MLPSLKIVSKARRGESLVQLLMSAMAVLIGAGIVLVHFLYRAQLPWFVVGLAAVAATAAVVYLVSVLTGILKNREWEFSVSGDRLRWIERDRKTESLECEIRVGDIRAFIYEPGDAESCARLKLEMEDGTVTRFALVGPPSDATLLTFINFWRENYSDIPIRGLNDG